jgi:hypothetical protein
MKRFLRLTLFIALAASLGCETDRTKDPTSPSELTETNEAAFEAGQTIAAQGQAASCNLDQSQADFGGIGGGSIVVSNEQLVAQTFTAGASGKLCRVSVHIRKNLGEDCNGNPVKPGKLIAQIRTTESGTALVFGGNFGTTTALVPSETVLATRKLSAAHISESFGWIDIDFPKPAHVAAGERYALVLTSEEVPPDNACDEDDQSLPNYDWTVARGPDGSDHYPNGQMFDINTGLGSWSVSDLPSYPIFDELLFQTYVRPR